MEEEEEVIVKGEKPDHVTMVFSNIHNREDEIYVAKQKRS